MCGITGILKPGPAKELKAEIEKLIPYIEHRGPDGWGSYGAPGIALGHRRLSIIDLSLGSQPMVSGNSVITFNGEIYNYLELKKELESLGVLFETNSDTEVLQKAIDFWGDSAYSRLNGQFALLHWDKKRRILTAVRDRYGIRPLYFMKTEGGWYFSSEMKIFDHIGSRKRFWNPENLLEHGLIWNTLGDSTVYSNICSLEGGCFQKFSDEGTSGPKRYYVLGQDAGAMLTEAPDVLAEIFREKLSESVKLRLRSDVPVGCYLSGGIDSSVTSYLAKKINNKSFKSFSVTFSDPSFDESEFQKIMVNSLGFDHYSVNIDGKAVENNFYNAAKHFERPVFRTAPVPLFLLSEKVRETDVRVVLTGEASDEILFGYDTNKELKLLSLWKKGLSEEEITKILLQLNPHLDHYKDKEQVGFLKMYYEGFLDRFQSPLGGLVMRISNNQVLTNIFNKEWGLSFNFNNLADKVDSLTPPHVKQWGIYQKNQFWEMKTLLSGYLLSAQGDRMAMSHGIEGRFPFLDHNLIEWLMTVPTDVKINDFSTKHLLKDAFRDVIPEPIINRPKRPYTAPDIASFFPGGRRGELVKNYLNSDIVREYGIFEPKMVERLIFKIERRGLESAGYRDNMMTTYLLSSQIVESQIRNPEIKIVDYSNQTVSVLEEY